MSAALAFNFLWLPKLRQNIMQLFPDFKARFHLFAIEEFFTYSATACLTFALSRAPATVIEGIGGFQPFVVLVYALVFKRFFPQTFRESLDRGSVKKKSILFGAIIVGIILVTR